jgi:hypothetical protein
MAACSEENKPTATVQTGEAPAFEAKADGSKDEADFDCAVVLRSVGRIPNGPGFQTTCDLGRSGSCLYVWEGVVDVAEAVLEDVERVEVLFSTAQTGAQWYFVPAQAVGPAQNGFVSYRFMIDEFTPAAGMSMTSLNNTVIKLIPYVVRNGVRSFDHNRIASPFGVYELTLDNTWSIAADATCQQTESSIPEYELSYPDWEERLGGAPVSGGQLKVVYDAQRLFAEQSCLGSQGPVSAGTVMMGYSFGGEESYTEEIEFYSESYGYACQGETSPCITRRSSQPIIDLDPGVDHVEMWFYCVPSFSAGAPSNWKYDSNFGMNYRVDVQGGVAVGWAGDWAKHAARSGFVFELEDPLVYAGFSNMGWSVQAQVYVRDITDQPDVDVSKLRAWVESDVHDCTPGAAVTRVELSAAQHHTGLFGNNSLFRWPYEAAVGRCPQGSYRYRFLFSADGGRSMVTLGQGADIDADNAAEWRTLTVQ